jgi:glycosyltransferase involved in cell wall biosynthesis
MLSAIIPSYKDPSLHKTIQSILDNAVGEVEVIVVLDGYWTEIVDDPRVKVLHLGKNRGMRDAINAGVSIATGDLLMRTDEHCSFAKGFDKEIADSIKDNEIMTPTRYELDPIKWKRMNDAPVNFTKLVIQNVADGVQKFTAVPWKERDEEMKDVMVAETMGMQGSCWFMKKSWWDKVIVELQTEGYGQLIQDSTEMIFKTWKAGGRMMLNKRTWHAHRHRKFGRKHNNGTPENPANQNAGYKYAIDVWGQYFRDVIQPLWKI